MRKIVPECRALDSTPIEDIAIDPRMRHDMSAVLKGLQCVYCKAGSRAALFTILEAHFQPGTRRDVGRPGMDLWRVIVFAIVKQCLDLDYDALLYRANNHLLLRELLGHVCPPDRNTTPFEPQTARARTQETPAWPKHSKRTVNELKKRPCLCIRGRKKRVFGQSLAGATVTRWDSHPLGKSALSRRTRSQDGLPLSIHRQWEEEAKQIAHAEQEAPV